MISFLAGGRGLALRRLDQWPWGGLALCRLFPDKTKAQDLHGLRFGDTSESRATASS